MSLIILATNARSLVGFDQSPPRRTRDVGGPEGAVQRKGGPRPGLDKLRHHCGGRRGAETEGSMPRGKDARSSGDILRGGVKVVAHPTTHHLRRQLGFRV